MKKSYLSHCVAAITAASATLAAANLHAQTEDANQAEEEMVVMGIRSSILNSIEVKRNSDTLVEVISSGDLGSLPDASIADALGRLPGVTTVRQAGQASQLNIRGLAGDFIASTLNGREQASTSATTESSRWMAFDQYPAELINQAAVYKTPKASLIEGGVAGTVELTTIDPLAQDKAHTFSVNARVSFNDAAADTGADEIGNRFTASYSGKFAEDTLGVAVGYSHLDQPNAFQSSRAAADGLLGYRTNDIDGDGNEEIRPLAYQWQAGSGKDTRDSFVGVVTWQPIDALKVKFDYFRTEFESASSVHGVTVQGLQADNNNTGRVNYTGLDVDPNGFIQSGQWTITDPLGTQWNNASDAQTDTWIEARTEDQSTQAESDAYGLNVEWNITDTSTLSFDISSSEGHKTRADRIGSAASYAEVTATQWSESDNQTFTITQNGEETPDITLGAGTTLTGDTMYLSRYEEFPHVYDDTVDSFKIDFKQELDNAFISSFEVGVRSSERVFDAERGAFLFGSRNGQFNIVGVDPYCQDNLSGFQDGVDATPCTPLTIGSFGSIGSVDGAPDHVVVDLDGIADSVFGAGNYDGLKVWSNEWTVIESADLTEETLAFYGQINIDAEIGGIPVKGNIGVRRIETDQKATGISVRAPGEAEQTILDETGVVSTNHVDNTRGPEYTDTLPSLNLSFEITDNDIIRVGAAKVLGRPPVGQLKGGGGNWTGDTNENGDVEFNAWTKGAPGLDPFRANQYDISYEHYFEEAGAITVAAFYKDIESLIVTQTFNPGEASRQDFADSGIVFPEGAFYPGTLQTWVNAEGGYIQGLEVAITKTFDSLPGALSGLGVSASYAYTESEAEVGGGSLTQDNSNQPLPGLSENVWSATTFWDNENVSTHVNFRYRDEYTSNIAIPGATTPAEAGEYLTIDWQASYTLDSGVQFVIQANNLTDEASVVNYGEAGQLGSFATYGRQFYLGVNYQF
ncbi:MAG: iron complex outermembrane receptor protein [Flavobacteriales bacterium]|jgi:iron complex outermembrane receptor protein